MARHKNANWNLNNPTQRWEEVLTAVLMDIRDELQSLNNLLHCHNFTNIPFKLDRIRIAAEGTRRNTAKKRKPKVQQ